MTQFRHPYRWTELTAEDVEKLEERDRAIEDYVSAFTVVRQFDGALTTDVTPRITIRWGGTLRRVFVSLKDTGSSSTVLTVYRNGVSLGTVTLTSGTATSFADFRQDFVPSDYLTLAFTTLGTGAANAEVQADFT